MIGDHLDFLSQAAALLAQAAARSVNDEHYGRMLGNADSFISAGNSNLMTTSPLTFDNLAAAVAMLR